MSKEILRAEGVTKKFKNFTALNNVSITLEQGKIYGLIGKNGAGKTTFMRMAAGLGFPTKGNISLFGSENSADFQQELKRVGCLIEYPSMCANMSARENLKLHRIIRGIPNSELDNELLELVGLKDTGRKHIKDYSLGMRQRLGIAIAMIANPELVILDEPVNGLDPVGVVEIRNLIKKICEEKKITVLISSHNLPELFQTATDYIIIDKGEIKQTLTLEELEERCSHHIVVECDNPETCARVLEQQLHTTKYKVRKDKTIRIDDFLDDRKCVIKTFFENDIFPTKFAVEGDTLEKYYLSVVGGDSDD